MKAAEDIVVNIPGLAHIVRARVLDLLVMMISGTNFQDFAMPAPVGRRSSTVSMRELKPPRHDRRRSASLLVRARTRSASPMRGPDINAEENTVFDPLLQALALEYMGSFDFGQQPLLLGYFQQQISPLLWAPDVIIREAALSACCGYLRHSGVLTDVEHISFATREIVNAILMVGVADDDSRLRALALEHLGDGLFDRYLVRTTRQI